MTGRTNRRAAALLTALFITVVTSTMAVTIIDTETLHFSALRSTIDYDRARYLAEAGLQECVARLEANIDWWAGIANVAFPAGSANTCSAVVTDGPNGSVVVEATGTAGSITRKLVTTVKQGG